MCALAPHCAKDTASHDKRFSRPQGFGGRPLERLPARLAVCAAHRAVHPAFYYGMEAHFSMAALDSTIRALATTDSVPSELAATMPTPVLLEQNSCLGLADEGGVG